MAGINTIRPRGDVKANWETLNPILKKQEFGVEWETEVGVGEAKLKIGNGTAHWKNLDYALINDITKKVVTSFATVTAENPDLIEGSAIDVLWAITKKKFEFITNKITEINTSINGVKTIIGTFKNINIESGGTAEAVTTITDAIKKLDTGKLSTADIYNGLDSTNVALALSAAQGKSLNQTVTQLNSDFKTYRLDNVTFSRQADETFRTAYQYGENQVWWDIDTANHNVKARYYNGTSLSTIWDASTLKDDLDAVKINADNARFFRMEFNPDNNALVLRAHADNGDEIQLATSSAAINLMRKKASGSWETIWSK